MGEFVPAGNADRFRTALGRFGTGVTVVTIMGPRGPMGFTANSFTGLSLDPPLVLWSPSKTSLRFTHFAKAHHFAIHVLGGEQLALVARFARGGPGFAGLEHRTNAEGAPILPQALARFDCERYATHEAGDHLIIVGRVLRAESCDGEPLIFAHGRYGTFRPDDRA
ncbi:MAG: flavin reductase family protein [Paracoccaceae bacterium]